MNEAMASFEQDPHLVALLESFPMGVIAVDGEGRLRGLFSICSACKRIRSDEKAWEELECCIESHSHAMFSHGLCPDCVSELHPQYRAVGA